jgi:hypothetical protein
VSESPAPRRPKRFATLLGEVLELKPFTVSRGGASYERTRLSLRQEVPGVRAQYPETVFVRADRVPAECVVGSRVLVGVAYGNNPDGSKKPYCDALAVQLAA